jgi:hypothetical protein
VSGEQVLAAIEGAGGAVVALAIGCWLFLTGRLVSGRMHRERIDELKAAVAAERTRADAAVLAATTTNQVLSALHREASGQ